MLLHIVDSRIVVWNEALFWSEENEATRKLLKQHFMMTSSYGTALLFSLICAIKNGWANNRDAGDLRRHRARNNVTVMCYHLMFLFFSVTVVCVPVSIGKRVYKLWVYGQFMCKLSGYMQGKCTDSSWNLKYEYENENNIAKSCLRIRFILYQLVCL